ncbi:MAG: rod shape-determining protein MreD [Acidobacteria bacterium]|nr:rod shape-determining protein MreD [Acidobacteriota bacterium]MBI3426857.1 rod shape-determining protein MreD [Acidobacteriota bacterium]
MEKNALGSTRNLKIGASLLIAAFLQITLAQYINPGLRHIDWLLLVVVYLGLQQREHQVTLWTAILAGVIKDFSAGGQVIAISGIAYLLAGYLADRISSVIVLDNLPVRIATVAAASLINILVQLIGYQILRFPLASLTGQESLLAILVMGLIGNLLAAIPFFVLLDNVFQTTTRLGARRTAALRGMRRRRFISKKIKI